MNMKDGWINREATHSIRSLMLILLAVFLSTRDICGPTSFFVNVLAQIGLGYMVVFFLRGRGVLAQLLASGSSWAAIGCCFIFIHCRGRTSTMKPWVCLRIGRILQGSQPTGTRTRMLPLILIVGS